MLAYNIVTIICLVLMGLGVLSVVLNFVKKRNNREEFISYLREYKKGRMVLIYICVFPLLLAGLIYSGKPFFNAFTGSLGIIIDMVVLKFDPSNFEALMSDNLLYEVTIYISFVLVVLNAILFVWSVICQYLWNFIGNAKVKYAKEKVVIFGNNAHSHIIYKSEKNRKKIIVDSVKGEDAQTLYVENIVYADVKSTDKYAKDLVNKCAKTGEKVYVVINTECTPKDIDASAMAVNDAQNSLRKAMDQRDERNLEIARSFVNAIKSLDESQREKVLSSMRIFVFGDPRYDAIYNDLMADAMGAISYINKYQKMAIDFVDKYPFTRFMGAKHIDYTTSCVKNDVDVNGILIGFGKTNQQIFLTSVANNQFITEGENGVVLKKVKYHIFDRHYAEHNKNLNHSYYRYKNEVIMSKVDKAQYLPLPDYPAEEYYHHLDINDQDFYNRVKGIITASTKDANFIVIAFGSDLENLDLAQKLSSKIREWGVENTTVFVKVRSNHQGQGLVDNGTADYYPIGCEDEVVYDIENIIGDKIFKMSMLRDSVYALEYEATNCNTPMTEESIQKVKDACRRSWYVDKTPHERESNLYCTLSLRSKLNMMGLDYVEKTPEIQGLDEKTYLERYAGYDLPEKDEKYNFTLDGKPIIKYTLDFNDSRRTNLAIHEHYRWNSFMISKGFIPATIDEIVNERVVKNGNLRPTNGKYYPLRRHGNLTTFDGLVTFRKLVAERDLKQGETLLEAETKKDVIKYDYQLLDDAYWLLEKTGHIIIEKK